MGKVSNQSHQHKFSYIPAWIFPNENVTKTERLIVTCFGILLEDIREIEPEFGKILYGKRLQSFNVKYASLLEEAQNILKQIRSNSTPKFYLNKHCSVCEFNTSCREKAVQQNHLSLLGGIKPKEIEQFNNKGIFTVKQLSYIFRPRRNRKQRNIHTKPHSFELQSLAIREQKIYVYELPTLPTSSVEIYFDIEGIPDANFQYLIGVVIHEENKSSEYHFWADNKDEEKTVLQQFLALLSQYQEYTLFHYGSYETRYLKKISNFLDTESSKQQVEKILQSCCNILSFLYSNIYFPTYTNGLKDVASFLGFTWSAKNASGIQSIIWRKKWEETCKEELKRELIQYNKEDCYALMNVKNVIYSIVHNENITQGKSTAPETVYPEDIHSSGFSFQDKNFTFPEMKFIRDCSYFDYQQERVHIRGEERGKKVHPSKKKKSREKLPINKSIRITAKRCALCKSLHIKKTKIILSKKIVDLKFFDSGVERWITKYTTLKYHCNNCNEKFTTERYVNLRKNFGHNLKSWTIFQHIVNQESFDQIGFNLSELFGIHPTPSAIHAYKEYVSEYYKTTYDRLLEKILASKVIYVDETPFNMLNETAYAWIFTNSKEVVSIYKSTREGDFLKDLLKDFTGVLVSDFLQVYDTINCPQQKCLIHLLRDFNDDLIKNPFEEKFKEMTRLFTELLQKIVKTIDEYGLKKRHLKRHKREVKEFFTHVLHKEYTSEVAQKYQQRLEKNRNTLFTFLDYDNVSWNNTYAEHAIKLLATHR